MLSRTTRNNRVCFMLVNSFQLELGLSLCIPNTLLLISGGEVIYVPGPIAKLCFLGRTGGSRSLDKTEMITNVYGRIEAFSKLLIALGGLQVSPSFRLLGVVLMRSCRSWKSNLVEMSRCR